MSIDNAMLTTVCAQFIIILYSDGQSKNIMEFGDWA